MPSQTGQPLASSFHVKPEYPVTIDICSTAPDGGGRQNRLVVLRHQPTPIDGLAPTSLIHARAHHPGMARPTRSAPERPRGSESEALRSTQEIELRRREP